MKKIKFISIIFLLSLSFYSSLHAKNNYFSEGENLFFKKSLKKSKFKFEKDIVFNPKNEKSYLYLAKIYKLENNDKFNGKLIFHYQLGCLVNKKKQAQRAKCGDRALPSKSRL